MKRHNFALSSLTASLLLGATLGLPAVQPAMGQSGSESEGWERCFGIAQAGGNDGMASGPDEIVPGTAKTDYDGNAWVLVPMDECESIDTPAGRGSLTPLGG